MAGRWRRGGAWALLVPFVWLARPEPSSLLLGAPVAIAGLWIRGWAAGQLEKNRSLAVSGPYAFTRNPLYLGSFLIGVGVSVAGGVWWLPALFAAFFLSTYPRTMTRESARLSRRFGHDFVHYRDAVPPFFPRVLPYRPPEGSGLVRTRFRFDRYLRNREWEAALGVAAGLGFLTLRAVV